MSTKKLRTLAAPFVVAPPTGARIRTRVRPSESESTALRRIGDFLGDLSRRDLSARLALGRVSGKDDLRATRKQELTAQASSRWAGSITRASNDQYALGLRGLHAERDSLAAAINILTKRVAVPAAACDIATRTKGYRDASERFAKTRRLSALKNRLAGVQSRLSHERPRMTIGGNRLWRNRNHLEHAGLTEVAWRDRWDAARMFTTADGESGKRFGNETIRLTPQGAVTIKIPEALVAELGIGSHLRIAEPAVFSYRDSDWRDRANAHQAIRYDVSFDPQSRRWYLDASWKAPRNPHIPTVEQLGSARHLGVDLNADHLAACVIDSSGNPVGVPFTVPLALSGLSASTRDARLREAISALIRIAHNNACAVITIENLGFADARTVGRETMGRGRKGKTFRRTVAGIPTAKFRERLCAMAFRAGVWIIAVDPAYTSRWGGQHWAKPLQSQTPSVTVTGHHGAAAAIGRRGHGKKIRRRKTGLRSGQRTVVNHPRSRPDPSGVTADRTNALPHPPPTRRTGLAGSTDCQPPEDRSRGHTGQDSLLLSV